MADYELWLTDDSGNRLQVLKDVASFSYTRISHGLGTFQLDLPRDVFTLKPFFAPDWRVEVWRSAAQGVPLRLEDVFLLRKPNIFVRSEDSMEVLRFYGRNGLDLLNRRSVIQRNGTSWAVKTNEVDDMMKEVVRQQMLYGSALDKDGVVDNNRAWPQYEFTVQADSSLGPSVTKSFAGRNVMDVLKDLKQTSRQLNVTASTNRKIYFDVVPISLSSLSTGAPVGWEFRTYADLRGTDRTSGIEFSLENENLTGINYSENHLEEVTSVFVLGNGSGLSQLIQSLDSTRVNSSRWNRIEKIVSASNEGATAGLLDVAREELFNGRPVESLEAVILNSPGGRNVPRSLYGIDWDLGDRLPVNFSGKQFDMEISVVYVSVDSHGAEKITGRNEVDAT